MPRFKKSNICWFCGGSPVYAKGLCKKCYARAQNHNGDPRYLEKEYREPTFEYEMTWQEKYVQFLIENGTAEYANMQFVKPLDFDDTVESFIHDLPSRTRDIVLYYFRDGKPSTQISKAYGVTDSRIMQLIKKSYIHGNKLRLFLGDKELVNAHIRIEGELLRLSDSVISADTIIVDYMEANRSKLSVRAFNCFYRNYIPYDYENRRLKPYTVMDFIKDYNNSQCSSLFEYFKKAKKVGDITASELVEFFSLIFPSSVRKYS